ncbi:DUF1028 domain-containing protein [Jiella marina]|uniref:DUF1028 domain-containing protein n=1 Tax=Jiella sp. LLJ827 TaxID=2917712 RepID=UPI0021019F22|nr:DUF1028 domain-containing protein [Jiella sp. LLJ827]MCQ0988792.1 DUF1028 domain-containing protein [Jiella sp. LLJ827]
MMGIEANTFSIVGRCARTGELGVAVASAVPAVGAICPYVRPGVGAVTTQSWVNPYLAITILDALADGANAETALARAIESDSEAGLRQVGVVDAMGGSAVWTGESCTTWHDSKTGDDFSAQGNMLTGPDVIAALAATFEANPQDSLAERLLKCLEAAQAVGGDKRGKQAAGLLVFGSEAYAKVDLRVDEDPAPIARLRETYEIAKLQLMPFVEGMPKRDAPSAFPPSVMELLLKSPPERPGGGGSDQP